MSSPPARTICTLLYLATRAGPLGLEDEVGDR
jgi:hypothetical protein